MNDDLIYDSTGLQMTATAEACRLDAYLDAVGIPTIGFGSTGPDVHLGLRITYDEAMDRLAHDVHTAEEAVKRYVKIELTQGEYDALCDFTFNVGAGNFERSTLLKKLNAGDLAGAADELLQWNQAGGHELKGLTRRRENERELFLRP